MCQTLSFGRRLGGLAGLPEMPGRLAEHHILETEFVHTRERTMRVRCGVIARVHAVQNGVRLDDQWDFERNPPLVAGRRVAKQGGFPLKGHNFGQNVAS